MQAPERRSLTAGHPRSRSLGLSQVRIGARRPVHRLADVHRVDSITTSWFAPPSSWSAASGRQPDWLSIPAPTQRWLSTRPRRIHWWCPD